MPQEVLLKPTLTGSPQELNHLLTDHGSDLTATMAGGGRRKSKFFGNEDHIIQVFIMSAFQMFANAVETSINGLGPYPVVAGGGGASVPTQPNGRVIYDANLAHCRVVGTNADGDSTTWVRLVMEVNASGRTTIVSAFPR
jgi:hypothetical protein